MRQCVQEKPSDEIVEDLSISSAKQRAIHNEDAEIVGEVKDKLVWKVFNLYTTQMLFQEDL